MNKKFIDAEELIQMIRPGNKVTIFVTAGRGRNGLEWAEATGRCVIAPGRHQSHATLNMGGRHGTPATATSENIVRLSGRSTSLGESRGPFYALTCELTPPQRRAADDT